MYNYNPYTNYNSQFNPFNNQNNIQQMEQIRDQWDAKNNELMKYLQHQDTDYLETIIDQNRQIIDLLKERE